jgi:DHA3 family macrolide efflux protein-like MFS transporter
MDISILDKPLPENWKARFFTIWSGQAFSIFGSMLVQFALIWWITKTTGSATILAMASLVGLLPQVFLGPLVGAMVDRWNRRITMIVADSLVAAATLVLAALFWLNVIQVWHVFVLMFIRSIAGIFHWSAMQASTTLMVPKEFFSKLQGLNSMLNGGLNIISAPLGALLLEWLPMQGILAIDVSTAFIAVIPLLFIMIPQLEKKAVSASGKSQTNVWEDFRQGLAYVKSWPALMILLGMATLINFLLNPGFSLLPILVTKHFGGQALQLGYMESGWGIGVILGGLLLSIWGGFKRRMVTSMLGLFGIGIGSLFLGLLPPSALPFAIIAMFWLGFANPICNGPLLAVVQTAVAPEMQGRVFTLISSLAAGMSPLGLIVAGPVADALGVQTWFVVGGVGTILIALIGTSVRSVMNLDQVQRNVAVAVEASPLKAVQVEAD